MATAEVGVPLHDPSDSTERVRVTMLWVTPQPTHRNDPPYRNADGSEEPPPLTLSVYFLVTAYGTTTEEPEVAYDLLGKVMQTFHTMPVHELPDLSLPGAGWGEGPLDIVQVPTAADLMEKVFSPLQVRHRPWVLYEVGPVQLESLDAPQPGAPLVRPDGAILAGVEVMARPTIERITPARPARGGRIRIDGIWETHTPEVRIGDVVVAPGDVTIPEPGGPLIVRLQNIVPPTIPPGEHAVSIKADQLFSEPRTISVQDVDVSSVSAPLTLTHDMATDLVLHGRNLQDATEVAIWPDGGIATPSEVTTIVLAPADVTATQIQINSGGLTGLSHRLYRISVRISPLVYTPYVLMEFTS